MVQVQHGSVERGLVCLRKALAQLARPRAAGALPQFLEDPLGQIGSRRAADFTPHPPRDPLHFVGRARVGQRALPVRQLVNRPAAGGLLPGVAQRERRFPRGRVLRAPEETLLLRPFLFEQSPVLGGFEFGGFGREAGSDLRGELVA